MCLCAFAKGFHTNICPAVVVLMFPKRFFFFFVKKKKTKKIGDLRNRENPWRRANAGRGKKKPPSYIAGIATRVIISR